MVLLWTRARGSELASDLTLPPFDKAKSEKLMVIESTPMGTANPWYEMWEKANND